MVQFHDLDGRLPGPNDYWKLDTGNNLTSYGLREYLKEKNFALLKRVNKTRLRALYVRTQRGLMSYERMSTRELRLYAAQRGVKIIHVPKATKTTIKAQLEQADEDATFDRFSDHPAELSQNILQRHLDSLTTLQRPNNKTQPPITQASRMFSSLALPLFYDSYDMHLVSDGPVHDPYKFQPSTETAHLLQHIDGRNLGRVRSFLLDFNNLNVRMTIDLRENDPVSNLCNIYTWMAGYEALERNFATRAIRQQLLAALRAFALSMAARQGPLRFSVRDVDHMGELVRSSLVAATNG